MVETIHDVIECTEAEIAAHDAQLKKWARFPVKYLSRLVVELKSANTENERLRAENERLRHENIYLLRAHIADLENPEPGNAK